MLAYSVICTPALERWCSPESLLVITGTCSTDERTGELQVRADQIDTIGSLRSRALEKITVSLSHDAKLGSVLPSLSDLLQGMVGTHTDLEIQYFNSSGDGISMNLGTEWRVDVSDKLIEELHRLFGVPNVHLNYDPSPVSNAGTKTAGSGGLIPKSIKIAAMTPANHHHAAFPRFRTANR